MPRTVIDRICISIYEAAKLNLARCRCLANIIVAVIAMGMVAAGLSILVFQACVAVMRWMAGVTRNACGKLRDIVSRKGSSK